MAKPLARLHKPNSKNDMRQSSDSEGPETQHVEMTSGTGTRSHSHPNTPVDMSDERQLYSRTPLPSRTLANARIALQQLILRSRYDSSYMPLEESSSQDSINVPTKPPPARIVDQSSASNRRKSSSHRAGLDIGYTQENALPAISVGVNSRMPCWRIERIHPLLARGSPTLRWVFDAGTDFARFGWTDDMIYEYAYGWLEEALSDPAFRRYARPNILDGHGKDPLPALPPAPSTCYFHAWADTSEAPRQPARTDQQYAKNHSVHSNYMFHFEPLGDCSEADLELGRHKQSHTQRKASTDEDQPTQLSEYRWVWFSVAFLVLSMFICLFFKPIILHIPH
ncbi:hypothetical protein BDV26DRAFT_149875 [Aspergillus bertholletiae]|uniref:Uncharacterized protein n=1 Tax=Aspergillus bertholletiae TaxID=1226010 RepID=A0A5N7BE28_9EURO|nr:hypothetical protein BDV26DRAFT_149875 [Aspergillus bertholletiae]